MSSFSPATLSYLTEAGWYAGRKVSLLKYRAYLTGQGYAWFPAVAAFLEEFGDLLVRFKRRERLEVLDLAACDSSARFDPSRLQELYAQRVGSSQLCVIGEVYTGHLVLFMDDAGQVYGGFDDFLCVIGSSGLAAIEAICLNRSMQEIPSL
ncbi:MAG: SUKH-3 domain-containing protein [Janthinobacterium lividum]